MKKLNFKSFYIFNPDLKPKKRKPTEDEQQNAKILYYYPHDEDDIIKRSNSGIIEGTLGFLNEFQENDQDFLYVEMYRNISISKRYEGNFYLTFILEKSKDNQTIVDLFTSNLETKKQWHKIFLDNFYEMFVIWHGTLKSVFFTNNLFTDPMNSLDCSINTSDGFKADKIAYDVREDEAKYSKLKLIIQDFLFAYKENISLNRIPYLDNILYFPLTEMTYTKILLASQRLNEKLPDLRYISIIYKGYLLHNDSPIDSFSLLFNTFFSNLDGSSKYSSFSKPNFLISHTIYSSDLETNNLNDKVKSDFRKCFDISNNFFLLGIQKININNYHLFIPKIFIQSKNEYYKLVVYNYNGLILFMFLNDGFNYFTKMNILINIEKWIKRYFEDHMNILENLYVQKFVKMDINSFAYFNNANKSIKLSSNFFQKKTKFIDPEKLGTLIKIIRYNFHNSVSAITRLKTYYVYYLNTCDRKIVILLPESLSIQNLISSIDDIKKDLFDYIFVL